MQLFLKILAYWVVCGLPILLGWRLYKLYKEKGRPTAYYVGSLILYFGIAVWIPFALIRRILDIHTSVFPYLIVHLISTFSGSVMRKTALKKAA